MTRHTAAVITLSDGAHYGTREDTGGPRLAARLRDEAFDVIHTQILPDDKAAIVQCLTYLSDTLKVDVIATTGGTGLGPRDVTPEATSEVIQRTIPGMAEAMRMRTLEKTPFAMTSRQVVGVRNQTLIINFPGNPNGVDECFEIIQPVLHHVVQLLHGHTAH
ncbi:molybdenum cofactor biosynthesis protein [Alicyclobacillus acidoterrestris]|uniref:MogA/MoaB family molybdenum cofactor biosynthesis protein n=1 Tax=Alicyclobacillus suci TaxID=2816080 RepID=UPI001197F541|nr:MogA/MoaB family molybdenum cofactor biosynthesis protein [Alicyclobacillus suci]GEO26633.1 molybdenum cofactor biosynthesis protein [Alicyclobacillus acidoterrestris]